MMERMQNNQKYKGGYWNNQYHHIYYMLLKWHYWNIVSSSTATNCYHNDVADVAGDDEDH